MKRAALDVLVCPHDATSVRLAGGNDGDVDDGELTCGKGHRFAIRDGVPRLGWR
jgi:uncharacterized protein YbaR (Trm112 family)